MDVKNLKNISELIVKLDKSTKVNDINLIGKEYDIYRKYYSAKKNCPKLDCCLESSWDFNLDSKRNYEKDSLLLNLKVLEMYLTSILNEDNKIMSKKDFESKVFCDGSLFDAYSELEKIIKKATNKILLIDGYCDTDTLDLLKYKNTNVDVTIITYPSAPLKQNAITAFNQQYPNLTVKKNAAFHDRFIILDDVVCYMIGASLKDAGKKCFAIVEIKDKSSISEILNRVKTI